MLVENPRPSPTPSTGSEGPAETARSAASTHEVAGVEPGLHFHRYFTRAGEDPFASTEWELRDAVLINDKGEAIFEQLGVEVPKSWSQLAANVVASRYLRTRKDGKEPESSVRQLVARVVGSIRRWGFSDGYFSSADDADVFCDELAYLLIQQKAAFNSPVWFNVGVEEKPQCSACFINSVEDTMESILDLAKTEAMLFKFGSGTGTNLSSIRSSKEELTNGGTASGPVSFLKGYDSFAGVIKSGGKTRRAAKMALLDVSHPDIEAFISCKSAEERKARALIDAGYAAGFDVAGGAYDSVAYQNANHSVRVTDAFMEAVRSDGEWTTRAVTDGRPMETLEARSVFRAIATAAWECGDPGLQFDTTINSWHTCPESGRIEASNPCSEYLFLDDSACNLASLNLLSFRLEDGRFDVDAFCRACEIVITAQEILVDAASYPTPEIRANSSRFRPLGLGYANLGALLMANGVPYDSDRGRALAAAVTALMSGAAYAQSARIGAVKGPFEGFESNRLACAEVMRRHRDAVLSIPAEAPDELIDAARNAWDEVVAAAENGGLRNAQISALAPTGTIGFMMDCDTTGIEPDIALIKFKQLVGGGQLKLVNRTVATALRTLDYQEDAVEGIVSHLDQTGSIEGAPELKDCHLPVFDCAFRAANGARLIAANGHLRMLAAVQPFISGAISKTINLPPEATIEDIEELFLDAWGLGLKAISVYRDGCKSSQPLSAGSRKARANGRSEERRRLPAERNAITHKFEINNHEGYITVGLYEDGTPGEIFLVMAKEGSTISGLMDAFATAVSIALQYGVPLNTLVDKFSHSRFEPSGFTKNPQVPIAKSIMDYIFRWLASKFLDLEEQRAAGVIDRGLQEKVLPAAMPSGNGHVQKPSLFQQDAPSCHVCGLIMVRNGTCYKCLNCGATSGCS